jgi:hypothetical protein
MACHRLQPEEASVTQQWRPLLAQDATNISSITEYVEDRKWIKRVRKNIQTDPFAIRIIKQLEQSDDTCMENKFSLINGHFRKGKRLYVPWNKARHQILRARHDAPAAGDGGVRRTIDLLARDFWWPQMKGSIQNYVESCDICIRTKMARHKPYGLL